MKTYVLAGSGPFGTPVYHGKCTAVDEESALRRFQQEYPNGANYVLENREDDNRNLVPLLCSYWDTGAGELKSFIYANEVTQDTYSKTSQLFGI